MALKAIPSDEPSDNHTEVAGGSKPLDTNMSPSPNKDKQVPPSAEGESSLGLSLQKEGFSQEKPAHATAQLQEWQNDSKPVNGESQFFRSQKMQGLGELTQKADKPAGEEPGQADLELEQKMNSEEHVIVDDSMTINVILT